MHSVDLDSRLSASGRGSIRIWPLLLLLAVSSSAEAVRFGSYETIPSHPSPIDKRYIVLASYCGDGPQTPTVLRRVDQEWKLEVEYQLGACGVPAEGQSRLYAIELPREPEINYLTINTRLYSGPDGQFPSPVFEQIVYFQPHYATPPSVGGSWYAPSHPGQGLFLSLGDTGLAAVWGTYDDTGAPLWLVGKSTPLNGYRIEVPLHAARRGVFPSRATDQASSSYQPWGDAAFEYLGCGKMRLSWTADDSSTYPPGELELIQLTGEVTSACDVQRLARENHLTLVINVPQLILDTETSN